MDFKFCLLAPCSESPSLAMQKFRVTSPCMRNAELGNFFTKNRTEGGSPAAILAKIRKFQPLLLGSLLIFQVVLLASDTPY